MIIYIDGMYIVRYWRVITYSRHNINTKIMDMSNTGSTDFLQNNKLCKCFSLCFLWNFQHFHDCEFHFFYYFYIISQCSFGKQKQTIEKDCLLVTMLLNGVGPTWWSDFNFIFNQFRMESLLLFVEFFICCMFLQQFFL